jgi:hypothetical protein
MDLAPAALPTNARLRAAFQFHARCSNPLTQKILFRLRLASALLILSFQSSDVHHFFFTQSTESFNMKNDDCTPEDGIAYVVPTVSL